MQAGRHAGATQVAGSPGPWPLAARAPGLAAVTITHQTGSIQPDGMARRLDELRPLASTSRLFTAALLALVLVADAGRTAPWAYALVAAFSALTLLGLWRETTGRGISIHPVQFLVMVLMAVGVVRGTEHGMLLLPVMVQPLLMVNMLHGARWGTLTAAMAAAGLLIELSPPGIDLQALLPAMGLLLAVPFAALVSRPIAALRQRIQLAARLEHELDPRRGVQAVGLAMAQQLRAVVGGQRVVVCHRDAEQATVLVSDDDDGDYRASATLAERVLQGLADLPVVAMAVDTRRAGDSGFTGDVLALQRPAAITQVTQLAALLGAERLQLVPDAPGQRRSGWMLVCHGPGGRAGRPWPLRPLAAFAMDMRRLLQQASYVDTLQAEIAAHERERIGRDLHDSALQPYLGLKFAIEGLAMNCAPDNPLHAQVQDLRGVCDAELRELRETVSALRSGRPRGENTLVPALRRQATRFAGLFGIQTTLDLPDELATSRALSGAVLHMVNEALNNVRRHTRAQQVWVTLAQETDRLHLVVRDDAGQRSGQPAPTFEPRSLSERARELGGSLTMRRHLDLDTEIHITVPI